MHHKTILVIFAASILIGSAALTAVAQVGQLRGHVVIKQARAVPASDAVIDVYQTFPENNTKTNKKGEFIFAGLPFVGTYVIAASHPSARPNFVPGVKAGKDIDYEVELSPGDGKRLTFEEIKAANAGGGGGNGGPAPSGESASDKAKREEAIKKNAEIEATNKKITETNETIMRTFKAGNVALDAAKEALKAKNQDEAIKSMARP